MLTLDTYSHANPAMQEEAAALIAGPVFAAQTSGHATAGTNTPVGPARDDEDE